jgi:hypothetical protein
LGFGAPLKPAAYLEDHAPAQAKVMASLQEILQNQELLAITCSSASQNSALIAKSHQNHGAFEKRMLSSSQIVEAGPLRALMDVSAEQRDNAPLLKAASRMN